MRNWIDIVGALQESISPDQRVAILSNFRVKRGIKIGEKTQLWRGEGEDGGSGFASYGQGFYFTASRAYARQYGDVEEVSRTALPDNALRFDTVNDQQIWTQQAERVMGLEGRWHHHFTDYGDFIHAIDPTIDGLQIGKSRDAIFVAYN